MSCNRRAVFIDRDGVLNHSRVENGKPYAPITFEEFCLFDGVAKQLVRLKENGFCLIVVTNQPDIGNGITKVSELEKMHKFLLKTLPIDRIEVCMHSQDFGCPCRKPLPGMLFHSAVKMGISPLKSFLIGDRNTDILAGNAFGCRSILIDRSYREKLSALPWLKVSNLEESVDAILNFVLKNL